MKSMPKVQNSVTKPFIRYEGNVKEFWTKKEYEYQELILNDFVIHRERPGYYRSAIPKARVDLLYDGGFSFFDKRLALFTLFSQKMIVLLVVFIFVIFSKKSILNLFSIKYII